MNISYFRAIIKNRPVRVDLTQNLMRTHGIFGNKYQTSVMAHEKMQGDIIQPVAIFLRDKRVLNNEMPIFIFIFLFQVFFIHGFAKMKISY